jgi:hypothetical protein
MQEAEHAEAELRSELDGLEAEIQALDAQMCSQRPATGVSLQAFHVT